MDLVYLLQPLARVLPAPPRPHDKVGEQTVVSFLSLRCAASPGLMQVRCPLSPGAPAEPCSPLSWSHATHGPPGLWTSIMNHVKLLVTSF